MRILVTEQYKGTIRDVEIIKLSEKQVNDILLPLEQLLFLEMPTVIQELILQYPMIVDAPLGTKLHDTFYYKLRTCIQCIQPVYERDNYFHYFWNILRQDYFTKIVNQMKGKS
jgi:hypothetical protein